MLLCFYHHFFGLQEADTLAAIAMTAYHQQGEHDKALGAARLIRWALHLHIQSEGPVQQDCPDVGICRHASDTVPVMAIPCTGAGDSDMQQVLYYVATCILQCRSLTSREEKLRIHKYWKEVADLIQVATNSWHVQACPVAYKHGTCCLL